MIVNDRCAALALLFATSAGAHAQSQVRPESPPPPQHFQVSPWFYVDAFDTETVRADSATVQNGRSAPASLNNGAGQFTLAGGPEGDPINAALADMDGDSAPDLVISRRSGASLFMRGNEIGGFYLATPLPGTESGAVSIAAADIDADGDTDIALGGMDGQDSLVLLNNGWGEFTPLPVTGSAGTYVQIGLDDFTAAMTEFVDITGMAHPSDGPDFMGEAAYDLPFRILIEPVSGYGPEFSVGLALSDANGDGTADLIASESGNE